MVAMDNLFAKALYYIFGVKTRLQVAQGTYELSTGPSVEVTALALALAYEQKLFKRGDLLYFVGTGAGLSVASTLLRY